jgi:hypothetical protein
MKDKVNTRFRLWMILILLWIVNFTAACGVTEPDVTGRDTIHTWLLVRAPESTLPVGRPITVKSRSEAPLPGVSHTELYLVEFRTPDNALVFDNVLVRSDAAPFAQTVFTADQIFTPTAAGHYVIKVVSYDRVGRSDESEYIGFSVE